MGDWKRTPYNQNNGGMSTLTSDKEEPSVEPTQETTPLTGAKRDAAIKAMEMPGFLKRLTVRIMKLAREKGFFSPFADDMDLPGKSAAELATDIVVKALDGTYTWDAEKVPDFYCFCRSRAESILSNWLAKNRRTTTMSPILEEGDGEQLEANAVNTAKDGVNVYDKDGADIYDVLRFRDGGALGDRLVEDFAFSLPDGSHEQAIMMAIHDDREAVKRAYCREKLGLSERDYDAAMKRIRRGAPAFLKEWCLRNNINQADRKEVR